MCAFFCILVNSNVAYQTMRMNPALSDLMNYNVRPEAFLYQGNVSSKTVEISKELGLLYEKIIDNFVLSGLVSKKAHIVDLTISILSETKLSSNLPSRIAPFIEKGLKTLSPGDDNSTFFKFATSFISKNPEFKECFNAYFEALEILKKYSCSICRENARRTKNMQLPESYSKFEQTYDVIISTIQKPFNNFKEKADMVSMSQFCKSITEELPKYRPAVSLKTYLNLETLASIIGDESIVKCVNAEKREKSMEELINVLGNHPEISRYIPEAITNLFNELKLSFNSDHVRQFAKIAFKLQDATKLTRLFNVSILEHLPECSDDELVEIMSQLGIFGEPFREIVYETASEIHKADSKGDVMLKSMMQPKMAMAMRAPGAYIPEPCPAAPMTYFTAAPPMPMARRSGAIAPECCQAPPMAMKIGAPVECDEVPFDEMIDKDYEDVNQDYDDNQDDDESQDDDDSQDDESDEEPASEDANGSDDDMEDIMDTWN